MIRRVWAKGNYKPRDPKDLTHIVIHRSGPWPPAYGNPVNGAELNDIFANNDLGTGRKMPYHYVVSRDGLVTECVPWWLTSPHAKAWNPKSIGVAILQDLRHEEITQAAWRSLIELCCWLRAAVDSDLEIEGHTDLPNSTSDANKVCPGDGANLSWLREIVDIIGD